MVHTTWSENEYKNEASIPCFSSFSLTAIVRGCGVVHLIMQGAAARDDGMSFSK